MSRHTACTQKALPILRRYGIIDIMSILEIKNLSHIYDEKVLFNKASVTVNNGEHLGVVGLNGAGKSTFINILAGNLVQDDGEIKWLSGITKGYLDQFADIDRSLTVMEYLQTAFDELYKLNARMEELYGMMGSVSGDELEKTITKANNILEKLNSENFFDIDSQIKKAAGGLGINKYGYDTPIGQLSGGQRAKLMLCKLILSSPDIMLLDEPTNFLDAEHIDWLSEYLNGYKKTFLVISHDTYFLDRVCRGIISIENGMIKKFGGNYSQFLVLNEQLSKQYEDDYNRQQKQIEKMEDYIARNKSRAATAGMANARKKMLDRIEVMAKPVVIYDAEFSFPCEALHTKELLKVKDLVIGYGTPLLPPISFVLGGGDKLWIQGTNGIGKTTLVKTLVGALPPLSGTFAFHPAVKSGYLEQELNFDEPNAMAYFNKFYPRMGAKETRTKLAAVGIKNELALNGLDKLSGGEQVRIKLCVLMQKTTNLLVLDEPTNHLDVRAKAALKKALIEYPGALILVSHEKDFAGDICNMRYSFKGA